MLVANIINGYSNSIEVFHIIDNKLRHVRTIQDPRIYTPNSIHALEDIQFRADDGTPSFFFTNDHYFRNDLLRAIETIFVPWSNIGFYNARLDSVENGVQGLWFANGLSGSDRALLVTETYKRDVKLYEIEMSVDAFNIPHAHLQFIKEAKFNMAVDNVVYYPEKNVAIVAGHPKPFNLVHAMVNANDNTTSQAGTQVDVWNLNTDETKTLTQDNGSFYGGSTTGSIDFNSRKLLVSSISEEGILVCDIM